MRRSRSCARPAASIPPTFRRSPVISWRCISSDRISPEEIDVAIREWGARFSLEHPASAPTTVRTGTGHPERLRVGFISGDFRTHSVAHFFEPILSARDRSAFTYVLYSNSHIQDAVTQRLRAYADDWRDIWRLTDDALIELIRTDRIDILVDLSGHTAIQPVGGFRATCGARASQLSGVPGLDRPGDDGLSHYRCRYRSAGTCR